MQLSQFIVSCRFRKMRKKRQRQRVSWKKNGKPINQWVLDFWIPVLVLFWMCIACNGQQHLVFMCVFFWCESDDECENGYIVWMDSFSFTSFRFIQFEFYFPNLTVDPPKSCASQRSQTREKKEKSLCATSVSDIIYQATHPVCCLCKSIFIILSIYLLSYIHIYPMLFACLQSDQMKQREKVATLAQCKHKPKFNFHFISFLVWVHRMPLPLPLLSFLHFLSKLWVCISAAWTDNNKKLSSLHRLQYSKSKTEFSCWKAKELQAHERIRIVKILGNA